MAAWQQGLKSFMKSCWLYLAIIIAVALLNSLFNARGLSPAFFFLGNLVTCEALIYGACSGMMLASVLLWFSVLQRLVSPQGFLALFSPFVPTIALMTTKIMSFIPELIAHAKSINAVRRIMVPKASGNVAYAARLSSQLLEWGMEASLITADSMRARGFGAAGRTSYRAMSLSCRDVSMLVVLVLLTLCAAVTNYAVAADYSFYPYLDALALWWWYVPTLVLALFPLLYEGGVRLRWRFLR
jgi:energy-coupling factor transport system permease protein